MLVKSHFKIADDFDVLPLQIALKRQPWLFGEQTYREGIAYGVHTAMKDIWVRYNDIKSFLEKGSFEGFNDEHDSVWYPPYYMLPQIRPIIFKLMSLVEGERLGGVLITKVPPGGKVAIHVDDSWHARYYDKYYIPVQNADGAIFGFPDGVLKPKLGEVFWFDNSIPHWVDNNSNEDRIALVVCIRSDSTKNTVRIQYNCRGKADIPIVE